MLAADTIVFAGSEISSGKTGVFALDAASGALRWRVELPAAPGARAGAAAANDSAYISWWEAPPDDPGSGGPTLRAYELESGEEQWVFRVSDIEAPNQPVGTGSLTTPVVVGESVLFGVAVRAPAPDSAGNADGLYAVDSTSGAMRWRAATTPIRSAPAVLDGVVYAMGGLRPRGGASGGNLLAFGTD
jgi:outer membrane protein assembly factor BamB